jgi:hypothetical protein
MLDMDLLVKPDAIPAAVASLRERGFLQGKVDSLNLCIDGMTEEEHREAEEGGYELLPFRKFVRNVELDKYGELIRRKIRKDRFACQDGSIYQLIEFDLHFNISIGIEIADLWASQQQFFLPSGRTANGQTPSDALWFLGSRLYHEAMIFDAPVMRVFLDVLAIVSRVSDGIDWHRICAMADKYSLQPALYYCFLHVGEFLPEIVPSFVLERLNPGKPGTSRFHDWGDFSSKMLRTVTFTPILTSQ